MAPIFSLILLAAVISTQSLSPDVLDAGEKRSAYDVIQDYNFPVGILPIGVRDYEIDTVTGKFAAFYNKTCSFSLEGSYQLQYKSTIKGLISKNRLTNLEGVKVKLWFMWVDIVEVSRKDDNLSFSVGIAGADFGVDNFEECPQCGCGLNCGIEKMEKLDLVSSY